MSRLRKADITVDTFKCWEKLQVLLSPIDFYRFNYLPLTLMGLKCLPTSFYD